MRKSLAGRLVFAVLLFATTAVGQAAPQPETPCDLQAQRLCADHQVTVSIKGTVMSGERPAPDAVVLLRGEEKPGDAPYRSIALSDAIGRFVFLGVKAGIYTLQIEHAKFEVLKTTLQFDGKVTKNLGRMALTPVLGPTKPLAGREVRVYYVTDRDHASCTASPCYGDERASGGGLSYGFTDVTFPSDSPGSVGTLGRKSEESKTDFFTDLRNKSTEALVFVHGFDNSLDSAVRELAALQYEINFDGPVILFSWASKDELDAYFEDESTIDWSTPHFRQFLDELNRNEFRIHLLAHSMGSRLLLRGLETCQPWVPPGQVIFAAPDIDADTFQEAVIALQAIKNHLTMYASQWDQALLFSGSLHRLPRAGLFDDKSIMRGIDTIDASNVDPTFLHHSYLVSSTALKDDLAAILLNDDPTSQARAKHLKEVRGSRVYWQLTR